jgi:hypothetical protein
MHTSPVRKIPKPIATSHRSSSFYLLRVNAVSLSSAHEEMANAVGEMRRWG